MRVWLAHPGFRRTCGSCGLYLYGDDGAVRFDTKGEPEPRAGAPTPCLSCPKVPAWAKASGLDWKACREVADELTPANRSALDHYFRCKATLRFPADPIVEWYAGLIRQAEELADQQRGERTYEAVFALLTVLAAKRGR